MLCVQCIAGLLLLCLALVDGEPRGFEYFTKSVLRPYMPLNCSGTFKALTYNVAGLPGQNKPNLGTEIGEALTEEDVVFLQESWISAELIADAAKSAMPHAELSVKVGLQIDLDGVLSGAGSIVDSGGRNRKDPPLGGDGLGLLSRWRILSHEQHQWEVADCNAGDCLARKGFSLSRMVVGGCVLMDFYNLHGDAWDTDTGDPPEFFQEVTRTNLMQLADFINEHSRDRFVLVAGDFNQRYRYIGNILQVMIDATGLRDTQEASGHTDPSNEPVDKIFYRAPGEGSLVVRSWQYLKVGNPVGDPVTPEEAATFDPLSDHKPIRVVFEYDTSKMVGDPDSHT